MQTSLPEALLILVFRSARLNRRPNLTTFCRRSGVSVLELERAFSVLIERRLLAFGSHGESLTLEGLALAAALAKRARERQRPLVSCRSLAA